VFHCTDGSWVLWSEKFASLLELSCHEMSICLDETAIAVRFDGATGIGLAVGVDVEVGDGLGDSVDVGVGDGLGVCGVGDAVVVAVGVGVSPAASVLALAVLDQPDTIFGSTAFGSGSFFFSHALNVKTIAMIRYWYFMVA